MAQEISLHDLRRMNKTQLMLGVKEVHGKFTSREKIREALTDSLTVLDSYDSATGSLNEYDVVDDFRRHSCIEVFYRDGEHRTEKQFQLGLKGGRVKDESYRVLQVDFVVDGEVIKRLYMR